MKVSDVVKKYRDLRSELEQKSREFKAEEDRLKLAMAELESILLDQANELGVESFKTEHGTAYRTIKSYARLSTGDGKDTREEYAKRTGDFGLFTGHVNKTHAKELKDEGVNLSECGIDWIEEYAINFRKPN